MSDQIQQQPELDQLRELYLYLRTVGDPIRLQILRQLAQNGEMGVTHLARVLRVSQPLVSWHLGVLRRVRLVSLRKDGRLVWYSLNRPVFTLLCERLAAWAGERNGIQEGE